MTVIGTKRPFAAPQHFVCYWSNNGQRPNISPCPLSASLAVILKITSDAVAGVDADDLGQQRIEILPVVVGIAAAAAVTDAGIEATVRAEYQRASIVIWKIGMGLSLEDEFGIGVRHVGSSGDAVACYRDRARGLAGVVDIEEAVGRIAWIEGKPQQAALAAGQNSRRDVEEWRGQYLGAVIDLDGAALLDDEQPI